jgi:hypothetical protein
MVSNGNVGEEIENSDKEFIVVAEHDLKRCTRPPKDHFEKILEATYPPHPYPVKHKLKDCTMMKRFMSSVGTPKHGDKLERDPTGGGTVLREVEVTTIADRIRPRARSAMWLAGTRAPTHCSRNSDNSWTSEKLPTLYVVPYDARE